jgi:hypothetical protein
MFGGIKQSLHLDSTCCENCSNLFTGASKVSRKRYGHVIEFSRNVGEMCLSANRGCPFCTLLSTYNHQFAREDWKKTYPFEIILRYKNETATRSYDVREKMIINVSISPGLRLLPRSTSDEKSLALIYWWQRIPVRMAS